MSDVDAPTATLSGVVVVLLVDFLRQHRAWGWMRVVQGPSALKSTPGLLFAKVMGSGHDGGFGFVELALVHGAVKSHQGLACFEGTAFLRLDADDLGWHFGSQGGVAAGAELAAHFTAVHQGCCLR